MCISVKGGVSMKIISISLQKDGTAKPTIDYKAFTTEILKRLEDL